METKQKRVGLALGGGLVRGMAHVGVLRTFEEAGITIDVVAGSSVGSMIGAFYCAGLAMPTIEHLSSKWGWTRVSRLSLSARALFSFAAMEPWLEEIIGVRDFSELAKPLLVATTDLNLGIQYVLADGSVAQAVRASCSIPGFFDPVELHGRLLGDGSLTNSVPVSLLDDYGVDYTIGVDILQSSIRKRVGFMGYGFAGMEIMVRNAGGGVNLADCLIVPELGGKSYLRSRKELIDLGAAAARQAVPAIRAGLGME